MFISCEGVYKIGVSIEMEAANGCQRTSPPMQDFGKDAGTPGMREAAGPD